MGKVVALVFSGQGAQYAGMGKELYENSEAARAVFKMADSIRANTSEQCFNSSLEELTQTINAQPCLFTVSLAAAEALKENGVAVHITAGFSLGEVAALAFSGKLSYEDAFKLVCKRAEFMQQCALQEIGSMSAVMKLEACAVEEICKEAGVYTVNYNCPKQTVIAGKTEYILKANALVKEHGGMAVPLKVSGAFHSPLMQEASDKLKDYLQGVQINEAKIPIYSNVTAQIYNNDNSLIYKQVASPVLWQTTIENMARDGASVFIEVGAGKVLSGLIKKTLPEACVLNVENKQSLFDTLEVLNA